MKILFKTSSSDPDYDANISSAFVNITKELAQTILKRKKSFDLAKGDDDKLTEMYFWDGSVHWIDAEIADEDEEISLDDYSDYVVTEVEHNEEHEARTECDQMVISDRGVAWLCMPKHANIYISTPNVPFSEVEEAL